MGTIAAYEAINQIIKHADDAYLLHVDPRFLSRCVSRLAEGDYGAAPVELAGGSAL